MNHRKLRCIPLWMYIETDYVDLRNDYFYQGEIENDLKLYNMNLIQYLVEVVIKGYDGEYYDEKKLEANGMELFVDLLISLLIMIKYDKVEPTLAHAIYQSILDFKTGEYDILFSPKDLVEIKKDIGYIEDYFAKNPDLYCEPKTITRLIPWEGDYFKEHDEKYEKRYKRIQEKYRANIKKTAEVVSI